MSRPQSRRGLSLVDLAISLTIFFVVVGSYTRAVSSIRTETAGGSVRSSLAGAGNRAIRRIVDDIRYSGFVTVGGDDYPYVFTNGDADGAFDDLDHPAPLMIPNEAGAAPANAGPALPVAREVVFLLPDDADADGRPDLDADGWARWGGELISYVLVPDGASNRIERHVDGVRDRTIARNVSSMLIDTPESSGFVVPLGCVRVRITLSDFDADGRRLDHEVEALVRLRNGGV